MSDRRDEWGIVDPTPDPDAPPRPPTERLSPAARTWLVSLSDHAAAWTGKARPHDHTAASPEQEVAQWEHWYADDVTRLNRVFADDPSPATDAAHADLLGGVADRVTALAVVAGRQDRRAPHSRGLDRALLDWAKEAHRAALGEDGLLPRTAPGTETAERGDRRAARLAMETFTEELAYELQQAPDDLRRTLAVTLDDPFDRLAGQLVDRSGVAAARAASALDSARERSAHAMRTGYSRLIHTPPTTGRLHAAAKAAADAGIEEVQAALHGVGSPYFEQGLDRSLDLGLRGLRDTHRRATDGLADLGPDRGGEPVHGRRPDRFSGFGARPPDHPDHDRGV